MRPPPFSGTPTDSGWFRPGNRGGRKGYRLLARVRLSACLGKLRFVDGALRHRIVEVVPGDDVVPIKDRSRPEARDFQGCALGDACQHHVADGRAPKVMERAKAACGLKTPGAVPAEEARPAGRVVVRVLAVNPRPRTSIDEKRGPNPEVAENTAEKGSKPLRTISDGLRGVTWVGGADGTRPRDLRRDRPTWARIASGRPSGPREIFRRDKEARRRRCRSASQRRDDAVSTEKIRGTPATRGRCGPDQLNYDPAVDVREFWRGRRDSNPRPSA